MKRSMLCIVLGTVFAALALPAHAGKGGPTPTPTTTKQGRTDNKVYVGINWNFGAREGATAVLGYRAAKTNDRDRVHGAKVELTYVLSGAPMGFGEVRVKALQGRRSAQGELGLGYSIQGEAFLLNGGVQGAYVNAGTDYVFGKGWMPSIGINTLGRLRGATETTTCPAGSTLIGITCSI